MPGTHVHTTVQIFIVVVSALTAVTTTVQKFIVIVKPGTLGTTTVADIYRDDDDDDEGAKVAL